MANKVTMFLKEKLLLTWRGVIKENPTFVLVLGMCPTLGTTTSAENGFGMGVATMAVLIMSNAVIAMIKNLIPDKVRIPAFIVVIASFVTVIDMLMQAYVPSLYSALGVFIPLIVVNCIILGRAEMFASKNTVLNSALDGIGMGIDVKTSQGVIVVNIGYETTEISILSLGGIVLSRLIKVGGAKFDEAIRNAVRKEYSLIIGGKTAEKVKVSLSQLEEEGKGAVVYGRDIVTGLPVEREIPTALIVECLKEHFNTIIDNVKVILERTPPELAADIYRQGIYLTGGASQVSHLSQMVSNGTGLKVNVSDTPIESVALGLSKIIKEDNYKTVAYSIEGMGNGGR